MVKTKIICTIGPASSDPEIIEALINAGMSAARLNFSHGDYDEHRERIETIKHVRRRMNQNVAIIQDLSGPKIRVGDIPDGFVLEQDSEVFLKSSGPFVRQGRIAEIPVSYPYLADDVAPGATILLDDGYFELAVVEVAENRVRCRIVRGGILKSHKGVNFPGAELSETAPTPKDMKDLRFGVENGVDFVALSFVQRAADIKTLKEEIERLGGNQRVIAKLERETALDNLDEIIAESDAVMVARGDLGIEADIAMVPIYQKQIVDSCIASGIPVIVATQMLESMTDTPLPTRAEASDVATAIYAKADGIMLSGETAVGRYPVEAVNMMRRIAENVESRHTEATQRRRQRASDFQNSQERAVADAVCRTAASLSAAAIVAQTLSGDTARLMSMYRPSTSIIAATPREVTYYHLALVWGVHAVLIPAISEPFIEKVRNNDKLFIERGLLKDGDLTVVSAGIPEGKSGGTNIMKLNETGRT